VQGAPAARLAIRKTASSNTVWTSPILTLMSLGSMISASVKGEVTYWEALVKRHTAASSMIKSIIEQRYTCKQI